MASGALDLRFIFSSFFNHRGNPQQLQRSSIIVRGNYVQETTAIVESIDVGTTDQAKATKAGRLTRQERKSARQQQQRQGSNFQRDSDPHNISYYHEDLFVHCRNCHYLVPS